MIGYTPIQDCGFFRFGMSVSQTICYKFVVLLVPVRAATNCFI